ncbi:hypothetical protein A2W24_04135 [Microgenomates group bacterium RBG_16_45_19]|nr:MAG: hypothetical protein A2W24_04135 [Microgenomates group bacterium RBG_16_45_19]
MRIAKDNRNLPKQYYRSELKRCPHCHWKLKRWATLWRKYLSTLAGRFHVFSQGYRCANSDCPEPEAIYRSTEAETLSVPGCSYGIEVIVEVGYQRFWLQRTIQEIHGLLKERVLISERQILNLLAHFLALVRAGQPAKVAQLRAHWQKLGGLVLSIDGMQPEKGTPALYVVREVQVDVTLMAEILETADHQTLATHLLEPIKAWGLPVKGIISDAQESIRLAVAQVWPDQPHQNCQFHCLKEAGRPAFEADRALKTRLKKKLRGGLNRARQAIQALSETDPYRPVLLKYVRYLRFTLLVRSLPPFELGGLRMVQQLTLLEASLGRAQEKGGIDCCAA